MSDPDKCQLPGLPRMYEGSAKSGPEPFNHTVKRILAKPWNYYIKKYLKRIRNRVKDGYDRVQGQRRRTTTPPVCPPLPNFHSGDLVRVRSREEIQATLDPWKELKGCAFLESMWQYCGSTQRVLHPVERFLDERDYQVKRARGVVLLEGILCPGTPVFGRCDRGCHLFWRAEWLEMVDPVPSDAGGD